MTRVPAWFPAVAVVIVLGGAGPARGITFCEIGDAPPLFPGLPTVGPGPLTLIYGTLSDSADVDVYRIMVTDPAMFSATVVRGAGFDTQLFLFSLGGTGVTHDDDAASDVLQSTITGAFLPAPGSYSLAISEFDRDPVSPSGNLIWLTGPADVERAPDGPGAPSPLGDWLGSGIGGGEYWIQLTGCMPWTPGPSQAGVWQETGDAPAIVPGQPTPGGGSLIRIFGALSDSIDVDLYRIRILSAATFSARTAGGELGDTQLFLFGLTGVGIVFDDDRPDAGSAYSQLAGALIPAAGSYYLGVSEFDRRPSSVSGSMWLANPAYVERAPDGPGATDPLSYWTDAGSPNGGFYGVVLTGAAFDDGTVGVPGGRPAGPSAVRLEAGPNPSHRVVTIAYSIPEAGPVRIEIIDTQGRRVRTLLDERHAEPAKSLQWDGRDARGAAVAAGMYIVRLEAGGIARTRRIVWVGDR